MKLTPKESKEKGACIFCVSKKATKKVVIVLEDGTEICPKHFLPLMNFLNGMMNGKKEEETPLFDRKTA